MERTQGATYVECRTKVTGVTASIPGAERLCSNCSLLEDFGGRVKGGSETT